QRHGERQQRERPPGPARRLVKGGKGGIHGARYTAGRPTSLVMAPSRAPGPPMKLATLKDGSRDGQLVVVSRDLSHAHYATGIAHRLQQVLDDWGFLAPQLEDLSAQLNHGRARHAF